MSCGLSKLLIQKRLDSLLSQAERARLDSHLEGCAACRREGETQRRLGQLADRWGNRSAVQSDPGERFTAQVLSRLDQPLDAGSKPSRLTLWLPLAASLLLLGAIFLMPGLPQSDIGRLTPALSRLPAWLGANLTALPGDALSLLRQPQSALLPSWTSVLLSAVVVLNGVFFVYTRQSSAWRSVS